MTWGLCRGQVHLAGRYLYPINILHKKEITTMADNQLNQRQNLEAKLVAKAWADETFKVLLLSNPKQALKEFLASEGQKADWLEQFVVKCVEESANELILVLPANPDNLELSDEMLEALAGGKCISRM
ncbi:MAG TPA: NHLP leader peptide family RiPP precursor [Aggregatilineaceae bacterium]|nr:NHLP leader peptide family RiPP precursor [Aggregatilineaceae bacterium]